ncbi:MAG: O-antigen ligase family protein [Clostridia bacterium]|nr:O-antigen ligase family protein [Clostridia bacterium]
MQDSLRSLAFFWTSFLLALVIYGILSSEKRIETFLGVMTWTMAVVSIGAMIQRILGIEQDILLTDMNLNQGMPGRAYSTLGNPNNLAEFLMLFIPFAYVWATTRKKDLTKLLGLFLVGVGVLALILTYSRSGWLAFAIAATIFTILYKRQIFPALIVLILCCIPLLPQTVLNRIMTIGNLKDTSSSYRVNIWSSVLRMLKGRWIQGVGLGTGSFRAIYPSYSVGMTGAAPHSHMQFLEVLIEMGILGLLSLLWYSLSLIRRATAQTLRTAPGVLRGTLCAAVASITGITTIGFAEYTWFYPRVQLAFFIIAGVAMAAIKLAQQKNTDRSV